MFTYGLLKDKDDIRDFLFTRNEKRNLPPLFNIKMPKIRNQENIGACASFSITTILSSFYDTLVEFSPLFVYYNAREDEFGKNGIYEDSGNTLRGVLKSINKTGFCSEDVCKYIPSNISTKPSDVAYENAEDYLKNDKILYKRALNVEDIKEGIVDGYIPYLGIMIYENFYIDNVLKTGIIEYPSGKCYGGHAVVISGYDDCQNWFIVHNSWGENTGEDGYFYIPYEIFDKILMDCWLVKIIPDEVDYEKE